MTRLPRTLMMLTAVVCLVPGHAQDTASMPTVEERLVALERQVASLDTRFETRAATAARSLAGPDGGLSVTTRIDRLEHELATLAADVRRMERQAQAALREAGEARREAMEAARLARDVNTRLR